MCTHQVYFYAHNQRAFFCGKTHFVFVKCTFFQARRLPTLRIIPSTLFRISALALFAARVSSYHPSAAIALASTIHRVSWVVAARPARLALMITLPVFLSSASRVVSAFKERGEGCWLALGAGSMWWPAVSPSRKRWALVVYPFYRAPDNAAHCFDDTFHGYQARRDRTYSYCCGHVPGSLREN